MKRTTAGKCEQCALLYEWPGKLLLRDAACAFCHRPLQRTATGLLKPGRLAPAGLRPLKQSAETDGTLIAKAIFGTMAKKRR